MDDEYGDTVLIESLRLALLIEYERWRRLVGGMGNPGTNSLLRTATSLKFLVNENSTNQLLHFYSILLHRQ